MGTAIMGSHEQPSLWCALLEAVEAQSKNEPGLDYDAPYEAGHYLDTHGAWHSAWPSEEEEEEDCSHALTRLKAPKRKRESAHTKANVPGGPCMHCGATDSPQWRRPIDKDQTLCNACGIYYGRHRQLPRGKTKMSAPVVTVISEPVVAVSVDTAPVRAPAAVQHRPAPASAASEILLRPLRAVRTRSPSYKARSATSSEMDDDMPERESAAASSEPSIKRNRIGPVPHGVAAAPVPVLLALRRRSPAAPASPTDSGLSSHHHVTCHPLHALAAATLDSERKGTEVDGGAMSHTLFGAQRQRQSLPSSAAEAATLPMNDGDVTMPDIPNDSLPAGNDELTVAQQHNMVQPSQQPMLLPVLRAQPPRSLLQRTAMLATAAASATIKQEAAAEVDEEVQPAPATTDMPEVIMLRILTCQGPRCGWRAAL